MKKVLFFTLSILFSTYIFASKKTQPKIISTEPVEWKEVFLDGDERAKYKTIINFEELTADLEYLKYLLETSYAGYNEIKEAGFDIQNAIQDIKNKYQNQTEIEARKVYFDLCEKFEPFTNDNHFSLFSFLDRKAFCNHKQIFWTNTFVEKSSTSSEDEYFLSKTDQITLKPGEKFSGTQENLFYYPSAGKNTFRIAVLAEENPQTITTEFNGKKIKLNVFDDGAIEIRPMKYQEFETEKTGYVSINSFMQNNDPASKIVLEKFCNLGFKWRKKENIIIDMRSNTGGNSNYASYIWFALYSEKLKKYSYKDFNEVSPLCVNSFLEIESPSYAMILRSYIENFPSNFDAHEKRQIKKMYKHQVKNPQKITKTETFTNNLKGIPAFKGKIIILTDRNTYSCGEAIQVAAKTAFGKTDQVIIIGENSAGCLQFANVFYFTLPNSKIGLSLSFYKNMIRTSYSPWHGEGYGIFPDYWSTGSDLNETIFLITNDQEMKEKLEGIENRLM